MSEEGKEGHLCVLCNNKLESKEALREHFRKHANKEIDGKGRPVDRNGESPYDVRVKGRGYEKGTASKYVDGVIVCDECGEKFKCNTTAIQHKFRKHPFSNSKFYCPQCGMQFPLKIHRDKHLLNHSPPIVTRDIRCSKCGESFYNKKALDYHYSSMHQRLITLFQPVMTPPPSKKIKVNNAGDTQSVYYCHLCGFEYIVKYNLQKHLERQHTKAEQDNAPLEMIKCTTCEALFYNQRAYQNHNMYHKPDDLYVLTEEQRLATVSRVDQDFDIRRCVFGAEKYLPTYRQRRRPTTVPKPVGKIKDESSDEMSPPSSMDTSSESEDDMPLNKLLKKHQAKNAKPKMESNKSESEANSRVKGSGVEDRHKAKYVEVENKSLEEKKNQPDVKDNKNLKPKIDPSRQKLSSVSGKPIERGTRERLNENIQKLNEKLEKNLMNSYNVGKRHFIPNKEILGSRSNHEPVVMIEKYKAVVPEIIEIEDDSDSEVSKTDALSEIEKNTEEVSKPTVSKTIEEIKHEEEEVDVSNQTADKNLSPSSNERNMGVKNNKRKKQARKRNGRKLRPKSENTIQDIIEIEDSS